MIKYLGSLLCKNEKWSVPGIQNRLLKSLQWAWKGHMCILSQKSVTVHGNLVNYPNGWLLLESTDPDMYFSLTVLHLIVKRTPGLVHIDCKI